MLKEFKPALWFLAKFLGVYFLGNIVYGVYIEGFGQVADPLTSWVSEQIVFLLSAFGLETSSMADDFAPKVRILLESHSVISIYEGCNGLNVIIIFIAFLVAYAGNLPRLVWFIPLGILVIHLMNLTRIILLFYVAEYYEDYLYFTHKYLFTAIIYVGVLGLWYWWVTYLNKKVEHE